MSNQKVSDLTDGGAVQATDEFYAQRGSSQVKISGDKLGGSQTAILMASVAVSSAELLALDGDVPATWPILLAAPGGRFYYRVHSAVFHYRAGTTPYGNNSAFGLYSPTANDGGPVWFEVTPAGINQSDDRYTDVPNGTMENSQIASTPAAYYENAPVTLYASTMPTGGDGTLTVRLFYTLINGAP